MKIDESCSKCGMPTMSFEIDFSVIKLVILDLDETLWEGVLSEGNVVFSSDQKCLLNNLLDAGVVLSICSKNDPKQVDSYLHQLGINDFFVFKSVNWTPKGERVKQIIEQMQLREQNVLFIDDNATNRAEVQSACPMMMTADVDVLPAMYQYYDNLPKKDTERKRLEQYRILEKKAEFKASTGNNEEFLRKSNIQVTIKNNCLDNQDRILDLIQRANQLNFTKVRINAEDFVTLCQNKAVRTGYVEVKDAFGDYGITGFFALKGSCLLHFVFSCRTLNMGVEQYIYHQLHCPELTIVGEVASSLNEACPSWINQEKTLVAEDEKRQLDSGKIIFKGPCDLLQIFAYIRESSQIQTEFGYVDSRGVSIEGHNHTEQIKEALTMPHEQKEALLGKLPWGDEQMFFTHIFDDDVEYVVLSTLTDPNLGMYQDKETKGIVAFGEWIYDLTNPDIWDDYIHKRVFCANCNFTGELLLKFSKQFEFIGRITPEKMFDNICWIYEHLNPRAKLMLILGSEIDFDKNVQPTYANRHLYHQIINQKIRVWAQKHSNVYSLDVNEWVKDQSFFTNNINHFKREIYYQLSRKILDVINQDHCITGKSRTYFTIENFIQRLGRYIKRRMHKIFIRFSNTK
jgi:FkbH-like protein